MSHDIDQIIYHPDFNVQSPLKNDVALIKLRTKINFEKEIVPACINNNWDMGIVIQTKNGDKEILKSTHRKPLSDCLDFYSDKLNASAVNSNTLCYDRNKWYVPGSCEVCIYQILR